MAVAGLLALGVTFGATSYVLHARRSDAASAPRPAPVPEPATPAEPMTDAQSLAYLRGLYRTGDYRRCVRDGEVAGRSLDVLLVVLDCAEQGMLMRAAYSACQELNGRAPTHPRAVSCRERLDSRAHHRHSKLP
ncbi:MAG: hypothetical protein H6719_38575 [Sandaracinaceae bacterium]|nr:hypothetical protein [Sandaracinaceae bacterium]